MSKRKPITDAEFDSALEDLLHEMTGSSLLNIPGVYEVLSEFFNNQVIERVELERAEHESDDEDEVGR